MARQTLVLDASVGVKWFSSENEVDLNQAEAIRDARMSNRDQIVLQASAFMGEINYNSREELPHQIKRVTVDLIGKWGEDSAL
jgi:hypothetical protein